jgi:hypothetical protein
MRVLILFFFAAIPAVAEIPAYLTEEHGCAVLMSGSVGSIPSDPKLEKFWHDSNVEIGEFLKRDLTAGGYRVVPLVIMPAQAHSVRNLAANVQMRNKCNRVLQLKHTLGEDANGKFFEFTLGLYRAVLIDPQPDPAKISTTTREEYSRAYRYPLTPESMKTFFTSKFAHAAFEDMKAKGVLEPLK